MILNVHRDDTRLHAWTTSHVASAASLMEPPFRILLPGPSSLQRGISPHDIILGGPQGNQPSCWLGVIALVHLGLFHARS